MTISTFVHSSPIKVPDYTGLQEPAPGMIRGGKQYYFVLDYLGSVRAVVDVASGVVEQTIDYDSFGRVLSDSNPGYQPFGYAGGLYDHETGLTRFGARDYDATTGRWTAPDPIGFDGGQFNLYVYVNDDPINFVDKAGFFSRPSPGELLLAGGVGAVITGSGNVIGEHVRAAKQGREPDYWEALQIGLASGFLAGISTDLIGRVNPKMGVVAGTSISSGLTAYMNVNYGLVQCRDRSEYVAEP